MLNYPLSFKDFKGNKFRLSIGAKLTTKKKKQTHGSRKKIYFFGQ